MSIEVRVNGNDHTLAEFEDLPILISREFSAICPSTVDTAELEIPYQTPDGYQVLCVPQVKSVGFVDHFYVETAEAGKIKVWGNQMAGKSVAATVIFIKQNTAVAG